MARPKGPSDVIKGLLAPYTPVLGIEPGVSYMLGHHSTIAQPFLVLNQILPIVTKTAIPD